MLIRSLTAALLMGASCLATAGELSLFTGPDFIGREARFNSPVHDLGRIGLNDRGSSLVVHSGRWQVCEHANFQGQCVLLDRGEYPDLRRLGNRISSLREVDDRNYERHYDRNYERRGWNDDRSGGWRGGEYEQDRRYGWGRDDGYGRDGGRGYRDDSYRGPAIELYRKAEFRSDRRDLNEAVLRDFGVIGFHDKTQSLVIRYGQWEFCEHPDFRGRCEVYGPGRYAHLGHMSSKFSSMRRVR